jgi:arginase family enzyme
MKDQRAWADWSAVSLGFSFAHLGHLGPSRTGHGNANERDWPLQQGIRMISIEEFEDLGVDAVIGEALRVVGKNPTYLSFDIDSLDPAYAPQRSGSHQSPG